MKTWMFQLSSGYSGRLNAKTLRKAKKYLKKQYPDSKIYLLIDEAKIFVEYQYAKKPYQKLSPSLY